MTDAPDPDDTSPPRKTTTRGTATNRDNATAGEEATTRQGRRRRRGNVLGISTLWWTISTVIITLVIEPFAGSIVGTLVKNLFGTSGWYRYIMPALIVILLGSLCLVVVWWIWKKPVEDDRPGATEHQAELARYADQAEEWMFALGSFNGGMAAGEWFEKNESALLSLLHSPEFGMESVDDLARICDALDALYVRQRRGGDLLLTSRRLAVIAGRARRRDLLELAAIRKATAHRLMGNPKQALTTLDESPPTGPRHRVAGSLSVRRRLEHALNQLAQADSGAEPDERQEAIRDARHMLDEARRAVPRADPAADVAIHINYGVVFLHQQNTDRALEYLWLAVARASKIGDAGARAHALELIGVAAWMRDNRDEAVDRWKEAEHLYSLVDEREGQGRCLQNLGAAKLSAGQPTSALELLQRSEELRGQGHPLLADYLRQARAELKPGQGTETTAEHPAHSGNRRFRAFLRRLGDKLTWLGRML